MAHSFRTEFMQHLQVGAPGFWITTFEESRVVPEILLAAGEASYSVYQWSVISGLSLPGKDHPQSLVPIDAPIFTVFNWLLENGKKPWVLLLYDYHEQFNAGNKRFFREFLERSIGGPRNTLVFISPKHDIPLELSRTLVPLRFSLPQALELEAPLKRAYRGALDETPLPARQALIESALGLTTVEAEIAFRLARLRHKGKVHEAAQEIWDSKMRLWENSGLVGVRQPSETWEDVGGCYEFKKWIDARLLMFEPEARQKKKPVPKGVLFVGSYGTGKSLLSRVIAAKLRWRLIEWDLGKLLGPYVGTSEQNTDRLLEITDLHRPCVVRIDEIAHQMSGFESSGYTDSGVISRMIQKILTWMEERQDGVFVVGSTNEPWRLPPHMVRAGRFDAIFHIPLPGADALEDILVIHLRRYCDGNAPKDIDTGALVQRMHQNRFAGAEVEQMVIEAVQMAYPNDPTAKDFERASFGIVPAAVTMAEPIQKLEEWASKRARPA